MSERNIHIGVISSPGKGDKMVHRPILFGDTTAADVAMPSVALSENKQVDGFGFGSTRLPCAAPFIVGLDRWFAGLIVALSTCSLLLSHSLKMSLTIASRCLSPEFSFPFGRHQRKHTLPATTGPTTPFPPMRNCND